MFDYDLSINSFDDVFAVVFISIVILTSAVLSIPFFLIYIVVVGFKKAFKAIEAWAFDPYYDHSL